MRSILSRVLAALAIVVPVVAAATSSAPAMAATAAGSSGYHHVSTIQIHDWSTEHTAHATGLVRWYVSRGGGFLPPVVRADIDGSVHAIRPTGCIYARVTFNFITGSVSYPSPALGGGSSTDGWIRSCRHGRQRMPSPISLAGIGFPKRTLNSVTITVGTSHLSPKGARYQGIEKIGPYGRISS